MSDGAMDAGMQPSRIHRIVSEEEAVDAILGMAGPRDLLVLLPTSVNQVWQAIQSFEPPASDPDLPCVAELARG